MALEALSDAHGQPFFAGEQAVPQKTARKTSASARRDTSQGTIIEEHENPYINTSFLFPSSNKPLIKKLDPSFKALIDSILR